jgi:hypothetical protein
MSAHIEIGHSTCARGSWTRGCFCFSFCFGSFQKKILFWFASSWKESPILPLCSVSVDNDSIQDEHALATDMSLCHVHWART